MHLRSGTIYACDAPLNGMPIMHLPEVMRTRPCPLCDHPRDPLSSDCFKTARQTWSFHYDATQHWNYCKVHYLDPDYDGYCHEHVQQASHYTWVCTACNMVWWEPGFNIDGVPNSYDAAKLWQVFQPDEKRPTTRPLRAYVQRWRCKFSKTGFVLPVLCAHRIRTHRQADRVPDVNAMIALRESRINTGYR